MSRKAIPYYALTMKYMGVFGLVGVLCTFAIIAWMFGLFADKTSTTLNNTLGNPTGENGERLLPKPHGIEMQLSGIKMALTSYPLTNGDIPDASSGGYSSNAILRKLFVQSPGLSEKNFFMKGSFVSQHPPDGNTSGENALAAGENHWAYVRGPKAISSYRNVPVLIEPYRSGEDSYRQEDYGSGRGVVVLFSDGAIQTLQINDAGEPLKGGVNILSSEYKGWKGDPPTVYQPE